MIGRITDALLAHRYVVLLVVAIVAGLLATGIQRFEIDASADTLLTRDNAKYVRSKATTERFSPEEFLLVAYEPTNHDLLSARTFEDLRRLASRIVELDRVASVRSILNVPLLTLADGGSFSGLDAKKLTVEASGYSPGRVGRALVDHPIYEDLLINSQQTATALQVLFRANPELRDMQSRITELEVQALDDALTGEQREELVDLRSQAAPFEKALANSRNKEVEEIRDIVAEFDDDANIYLGGLHVLGYELVRIVKNDLLVFGSAIAAVIAFLLLILFREFRWVLIAAICCVVGIGSTIGLFGLLGLKATVVSANFVALQLILTLAVVVHLIIQYREFAREQQWDHLRLVRETMIEKAPPCAYAGSTTALGFGALLVSGFLPVIAFGWMMILATAVSLVTTLVLFPVLLATLGDRSDAEEPAFLRRWLGGFAGFAATRSWSIALAALVILLTSAVGFLRLDVENSFIDYFADDTEVHQELEFIDQKLGGSTPLDLVYPVPEPQGDLLLNADQFQDMQKLTALLEKHEAVGKILSLNNFTELAREVNGGKPLTEYEVTAAYRVIDSDLRESLLGSYYAADARLVRFSLRIQDTTKGLNRKTLLADLQKDASTILGEDSGFRFTNLFVLYQDILERLFAAQMSTLAVVFVALFLAFLIIFRSLKIAVIATVPNVLVTATVFGIMGWLSIPLDLMTITIAAVAMGIAVDDTLHYVHRYRSEAASNTPEDAIRRTHRSVGYAIVYTTIIIVAGFGSLVFSDFVPSTLFGLLTGASLVAALLFDLTILPALLARFGNRDSTAVRRAEVAQ